jgi:hypothetical protein
MTNSSLDNWEMEIIQTSFPLHLLFKGHSLLLTYLVEFILHLLFNHNTLALEKITQILKFVHQMEFALDSINVLVKMVILEMNANSQVVLENCRIKAMFVLQMVTAQNIMFVLVYQIMEERIVKFIWNQQMFCIPLV